MKRILSLLIICCILSSLFFLPSSAESSKFEELWEQKEEWLAEEGNPEYAEYLGATCDLNVLLYTDALDAYSLQWDDSESNIAAPLLCSYHWDDEDEIWSISCAELELLLKPYHQDRSQDGYGLYGQQPVALPYLKIALELLDVSKEELYAAREKMREEPLSIIEKIPILKTDSFKDALAHWERSSAYFAEALQDFMIEAMYLEDPIETAQLLLYPGAMLTNKGPVTAYNFYISIYNENDWKNMIPCVSKEQFEAFAEDTKRELSVLQNVPGDPTDYEAMKSNAFRALEQLEQNFYNPPPKAGDETAVYALLFTLSALPLAGLCVYGRKKRRKTI